MGLCLNTIENIQYNRQLYTENKTQPKINEEKFDWGMVAWINGKPNFVDKSVNKMG